MLEIILRIVKISPFRVHILHWQYCIVLYLEHHFKGNLNIKKQKVINLDTLIYITLTLST